MGKKGKGKARVRGTPINASFLGFTTITEDEGGAFAEITEKPEGGSTSTSVGITSAPMREANALIGKIKKLIIGRDGVVSASYALDEQYTVSHTYSREVIAHAKLLWENEYKSLGAHVMGPASKTTGDRDGIVQANFIRKMDTAKAYRFNVHVDVKD
ncbi:MAG: hypothetical protein QM500_20375 [Methylococcales bacterium]